MFGHIHLPPSLRFTPILYPLGFASLKSSTPICAAKMFQLSILDLYVYKSKHILDLYVLCCLKGQHVHSKPILPYLAANNDH